MTLSVASRLGALAAIGTVAACSAISSGDRELITFMDLTEERSAVGVVAPDGTERGLLARTERRDGDPQPSPDGATMAFVSEEGATTHLFVVSTADGEARQVTKDDGPGTAVDLDRWPDWSPDGSRLVYIRKDGDPTANPSGFWDVYVVDVATGESTNLTRTADTSEGFPDWSPDGTRIAFMEAAAGGNIDISVMNADGTGRRRLTDSPAQDTRPVWSPDGSMIAFSSTRAEIEGNDVFVMNPDGSNVRNLSSSLFEDNGPAWAPDGRTIAFHSLRNGGIGDVYAVDVGAAELRQVTRTPADEANPSWSPDGKRIIYTVDSDSDESWELWSIGADGADPRRVIDGVKDHWTPLWFQATGG